MLGWRCPKGVHMINVLVEIRSGVTRFRAAVWAESIEEALTLADTRYPSCETKVLFPIDPEAFFTKDMIPTSGIVRPVSPAEAAG